MKLPQLIFKNIFIIVFNDCKTKKCECIILIVEGKKKLNFKID